MKKSKLAVSSCPCGEGKALADCCGRFHAGKPAPTAERLMRSRYSAYVLGLESYLLATWHPSTRPISLDLANSKIKWMGLEVTEVGDEGDGATVSFVARFKDGGRAGKIVEKSRFVREEGVWRYLDGDLSD